MTTFISSVQTLSNLSPETAEKPVSLVFVIQFYSGKQLDKDTQSFYTEGTAGTGWACGN